LPAPASSFTANNPLIIRETLYDENPSSYFPFLNLLVDHLSGQTSDQATIETALDIISSHQLLPTQLSVSTYKLALGLHTAVPRIEAAYGWYESTINETSYGVEECGTWVEWRGKGFCSVDELRKDVERSIEQGHHAAM
jgi:UDP-glucose:glycoprotein glucosyltransferase